jgi:16S rRNA (cytosine967-C5)-methyltransferase
MKQEQAPIPNELASRIVAIQLLEDVLDRQLALDHALAAHKGFHELSILDRSFVRMIVTTCLRRLGQIDDLIMAAMNEAAPTHLPKVQMILRLGVTQIAFMDVPDYAIVNTCVDLAVYYKMPRLKGFVNAILRRILREGEEWFAQQDEVYLNIPEWLFHEWIEDFGADVAYKIGEASLLEADLDISVKNEAELARWAEDLEADILPTGSLRREAGGAVTELDGFREGAWWVQDAAAALPVKVMGDVAGKTVIDLCAAPGGKTMQLAARGAQVIALDRSAKRLKTLHENLERVGLSDLVRSEAADASVWQSPVLADYILLDAPCSATGTIRRHPDVLRLKTPADIERLTDTQARILRNACDQLASGGILVYCTCSLQKAESEDQVASLLAERADMKAVPITPDQVGGMKELINEHGSLRILPQHGSEYGGMDGFFVSVLQKQ